jgi:hypothetical protein
MWANRLIPGTDENRDFQNSLERITPIPPEKLQEAQAQAKQIDDLLLQDGYRPINGEFDKLRRKSKRSYDLPWYRPWGPNSIGDMAGKLNRSSEYKMFYARFSAITHSGAFQEHVQFEDDKLIFHPIRYLKEMKTIISFSVSTALGIYRSILAHYRFGELENFKLKYLNEWKERFWSIPDVTYRTTHDDPI